MYCVDDEINLIDTKTLSLLGFPAVIDRSSLGKQNGAGRLIIFLENREFCRGLPH